MSSVSEQPETGAAAVSDEDQDVSRGEAPVAARRPQRRAAAAAVAATAAAVAAAAASPPREEIPLPPLSAAAAARRRGGGRGSASREALLNPPRQPRGPLVPEEPQHLRNMSPTQAAAQYQGAALRLQGTLTTLQQKITRRTGHISSDDLDLIYRQFDAFVNLHPIYSPSARRARVLATAGQAAEAAAAQRRAARTVKKQRRPGDEPGGVGDHGPPPHPQWRQVAGSLAALAADAERLVGAAQTLQQHGGAGAGAGGGGVTTTMPHPPPPPPPPAPVWAALNALPPAPAGPPGGYPYGGGPAGPQALSQHSMHSTISSYAPHMSADPLAAAAAAAAPPGPPAGPTPGPEDSAAIAMATAAAMANARGATGGLDNRSAVDLLQMLAALGYGGGGSGAGAVDGGADELAATALMSLGTDEPEPPRRGPGRPPKRPAPAPAEGPVPPAPEIDRSVESQLLALLVQGLGSGMG